MNLYQYHINPGELKKLFAIYESYREEAWVRPELALVLAFEEYINEGEHESRQITFEKAIRILEIEDPRRPLRSDESTS